MNIRLFFKSFLYSLIVLISLSVIIFWSVKEDASPNEIRTDNFENTSTNKALSSSATLSHYMLKLENEVVNIYEVYSDNSKIHSGSLDIPVNTLREIDRLSFLHGIVVENPDEILHIAEDFSS